MKRSFLVTTEQGCTTASLKLVCVVVTDDGRVENFVEYRDQYDTLEMRASIYRNCNTQTYGLPFYKQPYTVTLEDAERIVTFLGYIEDMLKDKKPASFGEHVANVAKVAGIDLVTRLTKSGRTGQLVDCEFEHSEDIKGVVDRAYAECKEALNS